MSESKCGRAARPDRFADAMDEMEGVHLGDLPPLTTVLVWTMNSLYRLVITEGPEVYVQGGRFLPRPTSAYLDGASVGGSCLRVGWIAVGLLMEIRSGDRRIITSPICAITTQPLSLSVVH